MAGLCDVPCGAASVFLLKLFLLIKQLSIDASGNGSLYTGVSKLRAVQRVIIQPVQRASVSFHCF